MKRFGNERGEGKIGLLVALIIVGVVAFVGIKVIPVKVAAYEFREVLRSECRSGAVRTNDAAVAKRIMDRAEELEIPLTRKNLSVKRTRSEMIVSAQYELEIDLKLTTYTYRFDHKEKAPLF